MKILKSNEHSLIIKTFGIKDTLYLATTILIYFDLNNPDALLTEQDLWKTVPEQLGQGVVLDVGMPKPRGEILVTGKCFAPRGTTRPASEVRVRVGDIEKRLALFGSRYWKGTGPARRISDPEPFCELPVTWENAFGGHEFKDNPAGKGIDAVVLPDGRKLVPLPNIENPRHLIGSPDDRPEPAGFGPIDLMRPQRFKKQGTYDQKWQRERWPHFPDDMNYEFFNTAPDDQFISGFFQGNEKIEVVNMHPDIQAIQSRLPRVQLRCFITKKKELNRSAHSEDEVFEEVKTRIDTVWLFPSILRGLVAYRGTTKVLDDEYADVSRIFVATENPSESPHSVEHYLEEQKNMLNRMVPMNQKPLKDAQKKIGEAVKRFKSLPKEIQEMKMNAMGRSPKMPPLSSAEMKAGFDGSIRDSSALLTRLEAQATEMHLQYGHLVRVPLEMFGSFRAQLKDHQEVLDKSFASLDALEKERDGALSEVSKQIKQNVQPEDLKRAGIDPDNLMQEASINPWHDRLFPFVVQCRKALERNAPAQEMLCNLGLDKKTISRAWLGINAEKRIYRPKDCGLDSQTDEIAVIPGLVMPRFNEATLNRLTIRAGEVSVPGRDVLIKGSDTTPLFLPAATIIDLAGMVKAECAPVIRVSDELQAWLVEQEIGDVCSVIALEHPGERPGNEAAKAIKDATEFLIVLAAGTDGERELQPWVAIYPNARKLLLGKGSTVFDACKNGTDIRNWIMAALPSEFARANQVEPPLPETGNPPDKPIMDGFSIPSFDIKSMTGGLAQEIETLIKSKFDETLPAKEKILSQVKEAVTKAGRDPAQLLGAAETSSMPLAESGEIITKSVAEGRDRLRVAGHLTPEIEARMNEAAGKSLQMGKDAAAQFQEGMRKLEALRNHESSGGTQEAVNRKLKAAGIDADKIRKRTREEVVAMHERGESLAFAVLSGLDLSELDLRGIDLSNAECRRTKFCKALLDGARFDQTYAQEADFSGASLQNIKSEKGIFTKALFKDASLKDSELKMSSFQESDLSRADCSGGRYHMTIFQQAKLNEAVFSGAHADMCMFSSIDASGANFNGARLTKCVFQKAKLDHVDFSQAVFNSTLLQETVGKNVKFAGADMTKARMGGKSAFREADFRNIKLIQGSFRDSDLSGAMFQGSELEMAMLENCDLKSADFYRVTAKGASFSKSNLEGMDMRGINLFQGSLRKARLVNTDLTGSNLYGVDFYKAVMGNTRLDKANLKMTQLFGRTEYLPWEEKKY